MSKDDTEETSAARCDNAMWLNAFKCVNPSDEFAVEVGRDVIRMLMNGTPKSEPLDPYRKTTIELRCS